MEDNLIKKPSKNMRTIHEGTRKNAKSHELPRFFLCDLLLVSCAFVDRLPLSQAG